MSAYKFAGAATVAACLACGSAVAEEQILRFRLVVSFTNVAFSENPSVPGHTVGAGEAVGVAVFEDGRIAFKNFVVSMDDTEGAGGASGYSTYTFENGDSLNLKFTYDYTAEGGQGEYELLSGTGAYEGATGTGHFEPVEEPWGVQTDLLEGSFTLDVPAS